MRNERALRLLEKSEEIYEEYYSCTANGISTTCWTYVHTGCTLIRMSKVMFHIMNHSHEFLCMAILLYHLQPDNDSQHEILLNQTKALTEEEIEEQEVDEALTRQERLERHSRALAEEEIEEQELGAMWKMKLPPKMTGIELHIFFKTPLASTRLHDKFWHGHYKELCQKGPWGEVYYT